MKIKIDADPIITLLIMQLRERANTIIYDADKLIQELETLRASLTSYSAAGETK